MATTRCGLLLPILLLGLAVGCTPGIGDECESSVDCSLNGDRVCDRSFPGGYCTVFGCDQNTCPDDAVCVEFQFMTPRLSETSCLFPCESGGDCRDGYSCVAGEDVLEDGQQLARVLDSNISRFCLPSQR